MIDIADLDNLTTGLKKEIGFEHGRIVVFNDDEGTYAIEIDGKDWSTYISAEEAEGELRCLFKGIQLRRT